MPEFAVTAIGRDRPGIVAAISAALLELEGNIEDSQMSILRGHFAMMLLVSVPESVAATQLQQRLDRVRAELDLDQVAVKAVGELEAQRPKPSHVITVYGADHPGIVHSVSAELATRGVNITDLETRVAGAAESPFYVMILEVDLGDATEAEIDSALREVGEQAKVEVSVRPLATEAL